MEEIGWGFYLFFLFGPLIVIALFTVLMAELDQGWQVEDERGWKKRLEYRFAFIPFYASYFIAYHSKEFAGKHYSLVYVWSALNTVVSVWFLYMLYLGISLLVS